VRLVGDDLLDETRRLRRSVQVDGLESDFARLAHEGLTSARFGLQRGGALSETRAPCCLGLAQRRGAAYTVITSSTRSKAQVKQWIGRNG
jgi:hypothetical protein